MGDGGLLLIIWRQDLVGTVSSQGLAVTGPQAGAQVAEAVEIAVGQRLNPGSRVSHAKEMLAA
jgi:hypothetical protein